MAVESVDSALAMISRKKNRLSPNARAVLGIEDAKERMAAAQVIIEECLLGDAEELLFKSGDYQVLGQAALHYPRKPKNSIYDAYLPPSRITKALLAEIKLAACERGISVGAEVRRRLEKGR